ncbi:dipicolinate synthase subunit DpsA [Ferviditalea candida]|uniref:Dipicolinate synthase subunit DpsA n=1 Tax=Ferviditalea candida TaxID=3108399 RepID=A0ABU5ZNH4_9BACL|nr:dipicolinate synthase subunit DpsA [Paenibacillaceae bacterium T2]
MLKGLQVAFLGGDTRHLEMILRFVEWDANVVLIGFEQIHDRFNGVSMAKLAKEVLRKADVLILPVVGTDEDGRVESSYSTDTLVLDNVCMDWLPKHAKIYTGAAKPYLKNLCRNHGIDLVELFNRDDVAIYNSIPTAEGAIMMAIQNTDITIHGSRCMVLGFGRTGLTLAGMLQRLGAQVKVGVQKPDQFARASAMNFQPFFTKDLNDEVLDTDMIFNTVPDIILAAHVITRISHRAIIIDLASKPGGTDFRFAEKRGIKALLAPSLPGLVAPKTAGHILANALCELIQDELRPDQVMEYA